MKIKEFLEINPSPSCPIQGRHIIEYIDTSSVIEGRLYDVQQLVKTFPSRAQREIRTQDILISSVRPNLKHNYFVEENANGMIASSGFIHIRVKDSIKISPRFLYYYLTSPSQVNRYIKIADSSQSAYPSFNKDIIEEIEFPNIDLPTQLRIAAILGSIDEKIELNRKKITELEALAKTIYDYWFVQFDFPDKNGKPYKSSGGKMVWNEQLKREIPEGWEVKKLSNYTVKITKGTTPTSIGASFSESGIRFIKVENIINGYLISTPETFISHDIHMRMSRSSLEKNDLLITIAGRLGDVAIVPEQILPANTNQAVGIIRFKHEFIKTVPYVHAYLSSKQMYSKIQNLNAQSIQKNLNLEIVGQIDVLFDSVVVNHFSTFMETIFEDIFYLQEYNHKLISLRDTLLPLLMNGQVEVK